MKRVSLKKNNGTPTKKVLKIRSKVESALRPAARRHALLRDKATQGWSDKNKPTVSTKITYAKNSKQNLRWAVIINAKTAEGSTSGKSVYRLISDGTEVRRALMPDGFRAKTVPGRLGQFGAGGRPVDIGMHWEFDGIEAREFDELINEDSEPTVIANFDTAIKRGLKDIKNVG